MPDTKPTQETTTPTAITPGATAVAEPETPTTPTTTTPTTTDFPEAIRQGIYSRVGFYGAVQFRERTLFRTPDGHFYGLVIGVCSVFKDTELAGFETRGNDSNWAVVVEGQRERHVILGCQVAAITSYQMAKDGPVHVPSDLREAYVVP